jgi:hypothetical protein
MYTIGKLLFLKALFKIEPGRVMLLVNNVDDLRGLLLYRTVPSAGVSLPDVD